MARRLDLKSLVRVGFLLIYTLLGGLVLPPLTYELLVRLP